MNDLEEKSSLSGLLNKHSQEISILVIVCVLVFFGWRWIFPGKVTVANRSGETVTVDFHHTRMSGEPVTIADGDVWEKRMLRLGGGGATLWSADVTTESGREINSQRTEVHLWNGSRSASTFGLLINEDQVWMIGCTCIKCTGSY